MDKNLYFIALLLPEKISNEVLLIQKRCYEIYNSKKVLNSPPHITIIPPFSASIDDISKVKIILNKINREFEPITVVLDNFGKFDSRNIHIKVKDNLRLNELQEVVKHRLINVTTSNFTFTPHISIINRDIMPEVFTQAYNFFANEKFTRVFQCNSLSLLMLSQHNHVWMLQNNT